MKKSEIKNILVPIDFSHNSEMALNEAIKLADLLKADIFLLHVVEYLNEFNGYFYSVVPEMQTSLPLLTEFEKTVEKKMEEKKAEIIKKFGIKPEVFIISGQVYSEIIRFSKNKKIDLIVMGTHGVSGYKELFIGSNAQRVVNLSDVPVLTIQKEVNEAGFKNILIPIDNEWHSREKVNLALAIADIFGATIHIIGLIHSDEERDLNKFKIKLESIENLITKDKLLYKTTIVHGKNLAKDAMHYASENNCDLIIINTGHESELAGIFLGAFAQQIVNHSKIPVLSIKHKKGYLSIDTPGFGIS